MRTKNFYQTLYFWILLALLSGSLLGIYQPKIGLSLEPLGVSFIKLIKIFIPPIVFLTVITGIVQTGSLKKLGKVGFKAIIYFEIVSTFALLIGWFAGKLMQPGRLIKADVSQLDATPIMHYVQEAKELSFVEFITNIIPNNILEPFSKGDMLQVLFIAILFGVALLAIEEQAKSLVQVLEKITLCFFQMIRLLMYAAPVGVFGAMAYSTAKFGGQLLIPLLSLILTFYLTGIVFVLVVLGMIARYCGFSILHFLRYMLPELFLVLGTSSSESALPQLMRKLEQLGCQRETIGVVVPMGYSFNLDGTNIYITLAALFIAQALGIELTFAQQSALFATAMLTSKGAAGITGAGFITLAATLSVVPVIPAVGIVLILGIDRFMSEARALVNYIGNGIGAIAISRWEKEITAVQLQQALRKSLTQE